MPHLKPRKKYKRLFRDVYPKEVVDTNVDASNLNKLTQFALTNPKKLNLLGEYVLRRAKKDYARQHWGWVHVAAKIAAHLVKACHTDLALFANDILELVKFLFTQPQIRFRVEACELMSEVFLHLDDTGFRTAFEDLHRSLVSLLDSDAGQLDNTCRLRIAALRTLKQVVCLMETHTVSRHMAVGNFVNAILKNMSFAEQTHGIPEEVGKISREVFRYMLRSVPGTVELTLAATFKTLAASSDFGGAFASVVSHIVAEALQSQNIPLLFMEIKGIMRDIMQSGDENRIRSFLSFTAVLLLHARGHAGASAAEVFVFFLGQVPASPTSGIRRDVIAVVSSFIRREPRRSELQRGLLAIIDRIHGQEDHRPFYVATFHAVCEELATHLAVHTLRKIPPPLFIQALHATGACRDSDRSALVSALALLLVGGKDRGQQQQQQQPQHSTGQESWSSADIQSFYAAIGFALLHRRPSAGLTCAVFKVVCALISALGEDGCAHVVLLLDQLQNALLRADHEGIEESSHVVALSLCTIYYIANVTKSNPLQQYVERLYAAWQSCGVVIPGLRVGRDNANGLSLFESDRMEPGDCDLQSVAVDFDEVVTLSVSLPWWPKNIERDTIQYDIHAMRVDRGGEVHPMRQDSFAQGAIHRPVLEPQESSVSQGDSADSGTGYAFFWDVFVQAKADFDDTQTSIPPSGLCIPAGQRAGFDEILGIVLEKEDESAQHAALEDAVDVVDAIVRELGPKVHAEDDEKSDIRPLHLLDSDLIPAWKILGS